MAVDFIQPAPGAPFGPGFAVHVDSDFIGPLPSDSYWLMWIAPAADPEDVVQSSQLFTVANEREWVWGRDGLSGPAILAVLPGFAHGDTISITAELHSPTALLDSGTQTVVWDMTSGVPSILQTLLTGQSTAHVEVVEQIEEIDRAVHMDLGGLGRIGLSELLGLPTAGITSRQLITPDRTLTGTLARALVGLDVAALGLEWEVVDAPPGVGTIQGAPARWSRRILDIQQVGTDGFSNEYTRAFDSFHVDHYRLMFNPVGLTRLHYWIEPGITVRFYWLLLGI